MMEKTAKPFFSIIMSVYNCELYVEKALKSILIQTCADFELFIVDDASTDRSKELCHNWAYKDKRIKLMFLPEHVGVNEARNRVMLKVQGQYVTFADADDYLEPEVLYTARQFLQQQPVQILKCGFIEEYYSLRDKILGSIKILPAQGMYTGNLEGLAEFLFAPDKIQQFGFLWNSFYDNNFLQISKIKMNTDFCFGMDYIFNLDACSRTISIAYLSYSGYHYCKRGQKSLSGQRQKAYFAVQSLKVQATLARFPEWAAANTGVYQQFMWQYYVRSVYSLAARKLKYMERDTAIEALKDIYRTELFCRFRDVNFTSLSWKKRLLSMLLRREETGLIVCLCRFSNCLQKNFPVVFARIKW